eukprot:7382717-Prymnesium_polylepis.1
MRSRAQYPHKRIDPSAFRDVTHVRMELDTTRHDIGNMYKYMKSTVHSRARRPQSRGLWCSPLDLFAWVGVARWVLRCDRGEQPSRAVRQTVRSSALERCVSRCRLAHE